MNKVLKMKTEEWMSLVYIPLVLHHVHGILEPLSRRKRTTLTRGVPLHSLRYFSAPHSEMTVHAIPERVQLSI